MYLTRTIIHSAIAFPSLEIICNTITNVMFPGGFNDISKEGSYEFANTKATSNAETEFAMGREPTEMSCPGTAIVITLMHD